MACFQQLLADGAYGFHVHVYLYAEFLCEKVDEFNGGSRGASSEPPYVGVEDVDAVDYGHDAGCEAVAWCAVGVEVDVGLEGCFELGYYGCGAHGVYEAGHVLKRDDFRAEGFHFFCFLHEVLVCEDFFRLLGFLAHEACEESGLRQRCGVGLGVDGVAHGAVGYASEFVDEAYAFLYIVDVVERVEYTHHVQAVGYRFFVETFKHIVGVGFVAEQVAAARERRQQRTAFHGLGACTQAIPWRFVEVAHYRVGHCASPHFHDVEACVFVERQKFVDFSLAQTRCEE